MILKCFHIVTVLTFLALPALSQKENRHLRQGNRHYASGDYQKAEVDYLRAAKSSTGSPRAYFNLGNTWYMQGNYKQALSSFDTLRTFGMDDQTRSKSYYNLGNAMLKLASDSSHLAPELLPQTVEAYKQSLRLNPSDPDTKYNLAYAQKLLDKSQQQQQQQNQEQQQQNQEQQQQNQEQQQQNQEQQQQDQEQQQQDQEQQQQSGEEEQQSQQGKPEQAQEISKEDAERILEAMKNDEKQTLEKLKQAQIRQMRVIKSEKDW